MKKLIEPPFSKILIANRGEIACRIIRTAKRLGVRTAVIYSPAEHALPHSPLHVQLADEAVEIPASTPRASYLDIEQIIQTAQQLGAEAIHPGYGFLSENSKFAAACQQAGIVFIGPQSQALEMMGEKDEAKRIATEIHVPVITGYMGAEQTPEAFIAAAEKMGFPVLIKAVAGGGGKAQHIVNSVAELSALLPTAQREAQQSFANSQLMLEKYLPNARHIEVQIFGDNFNHYIHLFDRDCSVQRRYQKVIEEARAYDLHESVRTKLWSDALKIAEHIKYRGAGTIEFLVSGQEHYFLEMNTRLQVEHPVTEYITGVDLVEWQLRIAAGKPLPMTQDELLATVTENEHAIEVRICAEDPENDFFPATGKIEKIIFPDNVRIESGIEEKDVVTPYFDSLLAKLVVHGDSRQLAFYNLQQALAQTAIIGVTTNLGLLQRVVSQANVSEKFFTTNWLEQHPELFGSLQIENWLMYAAVYQYAQLLRNSNHAPWEQSDGWKLNSAAQLIFYFRLRGVEYRVILLFSGATANDRITLQIYANKSGEQLFSDLISCADLLKPDQNEYLIQVHNQDHRFRAYAVAEQLHLLTASDRAVVNTCLQVAESGFSSQAATSGLQAPMPGTIIQVFVEENQEVKTGDRLLTLEAMKMEYTIRASHEGVVKKLYYKSGDVVNAGAILVDI
jgi:3-methylcrotonyl-CoA carboxylase alpha subunit